MHYVCFHYEFEHGDVDLDAECQAGGCPSRRVGLSTTLTDWTDWSLTSFRLGRAIGVYETDGHWDKVGSAIWIDNTVGAGLHEAVVALAESGVLERRDDPDPEFRWPLRQ